jgi:hypothetical protein
MNYYKNYIEEKKICLTIGEYKMNYSYYVNDFLENNDIFLCRCSINRRFSYAIITDLQFIILHIIKENKLKGKMKFFLELNKLREMKSFPNEKKICLIWEEDALLKDLEYKQEIIFENPTNMKEFSDKIKEKKNKLLKLFYKFDDNEIRNSPSAILRMINYYESLFENINNKIKKNINNEDNNEKEEKYKSDGLYCKNMLIIYYKKALNLNCLDNKMKDKFNERLNSLISDKKFK